MEPLDQLLGARYRYLSFSCVGWHNQLASNSPASLRVPEPHSPSISAWVMSKNSQKLLPSGMGSL